MKKRHLRTLLAIAFLNFSIPAFSQNTKEIQQVDSLVKLINQSSFKIQRDTLNQDRPEMGLSMRTFLTTVSNGNELKKYINNVEVMRDLDASKKKMHSTNTFYFDQSKLIKVEEVVAEGEKKLEALWYYADNKPIYFTLKSDQAQARADQLLILGMSILEKFKL